MSYFIKEGYCINTGFEVYLDDDKNAGVYQLPVYSKGENLIIGLGLNSVLDVGCGYGIKLRDYISPVCVDIVGIDLEHSINYCKSNHDFGEWFVSDIEEDPFYLNRKFDLIICSDVIEHLYYPDKLFDYFRIHSHKDTLIVLSTPERDLHHGESHMGPPMNKTHIREWNREELKAYIEHSGYEVLSHDVVDETEGREILRGYDNDWNIDCYQWRGCQVALIKEKGK
jgi:SAM-dependent methyltransferase